MGPYPINLRYLQQNNIHYYVKSFIYTIYRYKYIYIYYILTATKSVLGVVTKWLASGSHFFPRKRAEYKNTNRGNLSAFAL